MGDSIVDAFLTLENGETQFTDVFDFEFINSTFPVLIEPPYTQPSPILPCEEPAPSIEDVPDLVPDCKPAVQDTIKELASLVSELLGRVASLEDQLQSETRRRRKAMDIMFKRAYLLLITCQRRDTG
ncbi:uncharacterized protein BDV17DRAFT_290717 [Aspergillus undulatus]|uniref:uncharacterized protein n=1 Tax=Aspergillus undulatus TaxID=1810928 RepID=UPI003CCD53F2